MPRRPLDLPPSHPLSVFSQDQTHFLLCLGKMQTLWKRPQNSHRDPVSPSSASAASVHGCWDTARPLRPPQPLADRGWHWGETHTLLQRASEQAWKTAAWTSKAGSFMCCRKDFLLNPYPGLFSQRGDTKRRSGARALCASHQLEACSSLMHLAELAAARR